MVEYDHPGGPVLRGGNLELWHSTDFEVMLSGPAECGKTYGALLKLDRLLIENPGAQAVLVRKVRDTIYSSVLQTYARKILKPGDGVRPFGGARPTWYDYPNGSRLWLAGFDDPGKALSSERDFAYVNQAEELAVDDWQVLTTRCTGRAGNAKYPQVFGDCNPGPPHHWIKNRPSLKVFESRHEDNPTLWDGRQWTEQGRRTLAVLDALTGVRKERLRYGRWVSAEGVVFEFDPRLHRLTLGQLAAAGVVDANGAPTCRALVAGVDWGFTAPGVLQLWGVDGDGRMYLLRELYLTRRVNSWWLHQAKEWQRQYRPVAFVCDPSEPALIEEWRRAGVNAVEGDNDRWPGIQAVQSRLKVQGDGRPRLYVYEHASAEVDPELVAARQPTGLLQEADSYVWKQYPDGRENKEETTGPDHACDDTRYVTRYVDKHYCGGPVRVGLPEPHQRSAAAQLPQHHLPLADRWKAKGFKL